MDLKGLATNLMNKLAIYCITILDTACTMNFNRLHDFYNFINMNIMCRYITCYYKTVQVVGKERNIESL